MEDGFFKSDAKSIVDMLFNAKIFVSDLTRDDLDSVEEVVTFMLQSRFESYQRVEALLQRIEKNKKQVV